MAKTENEFLKTMGGRLAEIHQKQQGKKVEYGGGGLPAGIEGGVARLKEIKIEKSKDKKDSKGNPLWYFYASGVCLTPEYHDGVRCVNGTTSIVETLADTEGTGKRTTLEQHYNWVVEQVAMLLGEKEVTFTLAQLPEKIDLLMKMKPCFTFRTWKGKKQTTGPYKDVEPKINHVWLGYVKYEQKVDQASFVKEEPSVNGVHEAQEGTAFEDGAQESFDYASATLNDLERVIEGCKDQDGDASEALYRIGEKAGCNREKLENATTWEQAQKMIEEASAMPVEETEEEPQEKLVLKVGNVYKYTPAGKKSPAKCELTKYDSKTGNCNLKDLATKKEYLKVKKEELKPA